MSRLHKRLIIIFCLGTLLCGVGAGVAFTEFSALTYGGRQLLGEPDFRTENFDVEFETGEEEQRVWCVGPCNPEIRTDSAVPDNTVRFCVTYNADSVKPYTYWSKEEGIVLSWYRISYHDETALMMEAKDLILQNLKEGKIVSFGVPGLEDVVVLVNAKSEKEVRLIH